jgi:hypothetical protein
VRAFRNSSLPIESSRCRNDHEDGGSTMPSPAAESAAPLSSAVTSVLANQTVACKIGVADRATEDAEIQDSGIHDFDDEESSRRLR